MALAPEISTPTADAGSSAGTAPSATPAPSGSPAAATPERTFTRAEVEAETNRVVQERLSRRSLTEHFRSQGWISPEEAARLRQPGTPAPTETPDPYAQDIRGLKQQMTDFQLDRAIESLGSRYPDFKANMREILELVVDQGLDKVTHMPLEQILDTAYRYWHHDKIVATPPVDVEKIRREAADQAVKDYLDKKKGTAAKTPKAEGPTGAAPVTPPRKFGSRKDMESAVKAILERES